MALNSIRPSYGSRARVGTLWEQAQQSEPRGPSNPLVFAATRSLSVGWSKRDEEKRLTGFMRAAEDKWQAPVTSLEKPAHVNDADWNAFKATKTIALVRSGRTPADVTDTIIRAAGSVDGEVIAPRNLFVQRYAPQGTPTGRTVVLAPGFLETGRNYVEQALILSARGDTVLVMDQQWAGLSEGARGGVDRGFGIARDVAAVAALADTPSIVIAGTSMGGLGAYIALRLNALGRINLEGKAMPRGVAGVLSSPYFARTRGIINGTLAASGRVPGLRNISLPALGVPILSHDQVSLRKIAAHAVNERVSGRAQAFHAPEADLARLTDMPVALDAPVYVMHAEQDPLADYEASKLWTARLGAMGHFESLASRNHVMEENPAEQRYLLDGLAWIAARGQPST